jgi:hypothetical protein
MTEPMLSAYQRQSRDPATDHNGDAAGPIQLGALKRAARERPPHRGWHQAHPARRVDLRMPWPVGGGFGRLDVVMLDQRWPVM